MDLLCFCSVLCLLCLCARTMSLFASVYMCFVVTCWERADLLALVCGVYCGVYCEFVTLSDKTFWIGAYKCTCTNLNLDRTY